MTRVLLIGQAPGPKTRNDAPLFPVPSTSAGGRLQEFMGVSRGDYLRLFDRANVLQGFPGKHKRDDKFPLRDAKIAARAMKTLLCARVVLLIGRNVAEAFELDMPFFEWRVASTGVMHPNRLLRGSFEVAVIPHTSGRCRVWNDPSISETARDFLSYLVLRAKERACLLGPPERKMIMSAHPAPLGTGEDHDEVHIPRPVVHD